MTGEVTRVDDDGTVTVRLHRHGRRDMCDLMIICWEQWHDGYVAAARAAMAEMGIDQRGSPGGVLEIGPVITETRYPFTRAGSVDVCFQVGEVRSGSTRIRKFKAHRTFMTVLNWTFLSPLSER